MTDRLPSRDQQRAESVADSHGLDVSTDKTRVMIIR